MDMLRTIFVTPWSTVFFAGNTLDYMALLLPASLASTLAFRAGLCNLGIEGQMYAGALAAAAFLLNVQPGAATMQLLSAALVAMLAGAVMSAICALVKIWTGANELITSFLLSAGIVPAADYLITGPLRDTSGNLLATRAIDGAFMLPRILPPSNLSVSFVVSLALPLAAFLFLSGTASGYRFRLVGKSPDLARYGGVNVEHYWLPAMGFSGALAGLSGFFAVTGTYGALHQGWSGGLGWAGIACALLANCRTLALVPACLFYAYLKSGTDTALLVSGARFQSSALIQACVLFFATAKWIRVKRAKEGGA